MQSDLTKPSQASPQTLQVAVAVISHNDLYLLGYRNSQQHQGERYEFVGGKLEPNEKPLQALIREVAEEIGIRIDDSACHKLGEIHHDYPEKSVCLHIFGVSLDDKQFESLQPKKIGELGQPLVWVSKADLLANKYQLPDANSEILSWLRDDGDK